MPTAVLYLGVAAAAIVEATVVTASATTRSRSVRRCIPSEREAGAEVVCSPIRRRPRADMPEGPRYRAWDVERKWWTLLVVCIAIFMLLLDITVVNVALPVIQDDLDADFSHLQ